MNNISGAEQVFVHVHRDNKAAQELYYKIGFQVNFRHFFQMTFLFLPFSGF